MIDLKKGMTKEIDSNRTNESSNGDIVRQGPSTRDLLATKTSSRFRDVCCLTGEKYDAMLTNLFS